MNSKPQTSAEWKQARRNRPAIALLQTQAVWLKAEAQPRPQRGRHGAAGRWAGLLWALGLWLWVAVGLGWAQANPRKINFQGKLLDSSNNPRNGTVLLNFRLYGSPTGCPGGGTAAWSETQPSVSVANGVFSVQLGNSVALNPNLFTATSAYLEIDVDPAGAEPQETLCPRQQLLMSPYAFVAARLAEDGDVSVRAGVLYSTFTSGGNLRVPYGVVADTAVFGGSLTASSGTFTATGNSQYSLQTSSGINVLSGTLASRGTGGVVVTATGGVQATYGVRAATGVFTATGNEQYSVDSSSGIRVRSGTLLSEGSGGVRVSADAGVNVSYGVTTSTLNLTGVAAEPAGANGQVYYNSSTNKYRAFEGGVWKNVIAPSGSQNIWDSDATGAVLAQGSNLPAGLTALDATIQGTQVQINCDDLGREVAMRVNMRQTGGGPNTITISIRDVNNVANVLASVAFTTVLGASSYIQETSYAAKPSWCAGLQTIGVYTEGGDGADDYIFRRIGLIWRP